LTRGRWAWARKGGNLEARCPREDNDRAKGGCTRCWYHGPDCPKRRLSQPRLKNKAFFGHRQRLTRACQRRKPLAAHEPRERGASEPAPASTHQVTVSARRARPPFREDSRRGHACISRGFPPCSGLQLSFFHVLPPTGMVTPVAPLRLTTEDRSRALKAFRWALLQPPRAALRLPPLSKAKHTTFA